MLMVARDDAGNAEFALGIKQWREHCTVEVSFQPVSIAFRQARLVEMLPVEQVSSQSTSDGEMSSTSSLAAQARATMQAHQTPPQEGSSIYWLLTPRSQPPRGGGHA